MRTGFLFSVSSSTPRGLACKKGGEPVDTRTVFQISSVTKGFLATTLAIAVDRGKFRWDLWP